MPPSSNTLTDAYAGIAKLNNLIYIGQITKVQQNGQVTVRINGHEYTVQAISDQPFFAGSQVRMVLDDKKCWVLLGTVR